jgi:hypothetical protein
MKKSTVFILISCLSLATFGTSNAQSDSVIISGRILNLTPALYRQAPVITFTRNNILQPQSELARQTPLQADGSFRVAIPLIYALEEVYLDYAGKVYSTFLAAPGTVQVSFDADSMFVAKKLFYFAGVNADANNQYNQYLAEEARLLKDNKKLGESFFGYFWQLNPSEARKTLERRTNLRASALLPLAQRGGVDPVLRTWVKAVLQEEQLTLLYEYALMNDISVERDAVDSLKRIIKAPMTFQKVQLLTRLGDYSDRVAERKAYFAPTQSKSMQVSKMATLIKEYVNPLSVEENQQLAAVINEGAASTRELDFLNSLYRRNRRTMDLLTMIENRERTYTEEFDKTIADLLNARYLVQHFYELELDEQKLLYNYVRPKIDQPVYGRSLDELYQLEVKDSTYIRLINGNKDLSASPTEVLSGIWLSQSNGNGKDWFKKIQELYKGKTLYVIKWNLLDPASRNELLYAPALRAQLPTDVEFLYVHIPNMEMTNKPTLWKQYIVRNKIKGVHMFLDETQAVQLLFKLNPMVIPSFGITKPNGRYFTRSAPAPSNGQDAAQAILRARQMR